MLVLFTCGNFFELINVNIIRETTTVTPTPCTFQNAQNEVIVIFSFLIDQNASVPIFVAAGKGFFLYLTGNTILYLDQYLDL